MFYDKEFLLKLDKTRNKNIYAKVIALSTNELPLEQITGRVTQGSINLDGASAIRRSCSLTLIADKFDYSNYLWGLNTKFKLKIGIENDIDSRYPKIIWFNQGIYVITSFNASRSTSNFTISLQGKDKMCLLNGEVSGTIGVQTDFGKIEEENKDGVWTIRSLPIVEIIKNMVHTYGGEPYSNIIIKDLDFLGKELLEYRYENVPLILYRKKDSLIYENIIFGNSPDPVYTDPSCSEVYKVYVQNIPTIAFEQLMDSFGDQVEPTTFYISPDRKDDKGNVQGYYFTKLQYGDAAGYRTTDITYAGDLIANIGDSITSVLDKIRSMLVEFEYFYDLDGRFVFQKKECVAATTWTLGADETAEIQSGLLLSTINAYDFYGGDLITAFNNNPNLLNVKNDFSIWGERKSVSGANIPIHLRYALDEKPIEYTTIGNFTEFDIDEIVAYNEKYGSTIPEESPISITYSTIPNFTQKTNYIYASDWREVLYQMAKDYYQYNFLTNFDNRLQACNRDLVINGKTNYEQYYTDIQVCWRELYNPELRFQIADLEEEIADIEADLKAANTAIIAYKNSIITLNNSISETKDQDELDSLSQDLLDAKVLLSDQEVLQQKLKNSLDKKTEKLKKYQDNLENFYQIKELTQLEKIYYRELKGSIADKTISCSNQIFKIPFTQIEILKDESDVQIPIQEKDILYSKKDDSYFRITKIENNFIYCAYYDNNKLHWHKNVYENQSALNYWFDFLDVLGELNSFNVRAIGARTKAINETNIKSIYYREVPDILFTENITENEYLSGYRYIQIPNLDNMFTISAQGKSTKDRLDELLYEHGYCNESATITTIPIYYLEPNTRIHISDPETNLDGDYIIDKISLPLTYNGTMTLNVTKAAQTLLF